MSALLDVHDLVVDYPGRRRRDRFRALHGVDLQVAAGETVGLVGESGSGKSTLGRAVLGLVPTVAGEISFDGEQIAHASRRRRRALSTELQVVFQDPYSSLNPALTVGEILTEPLRVHRSLSRDAARERVGELLAQVGMRADAGERLAREFSGGQRQRIAIARALCMEPRLVVCDEAVSALDVSTQAQVVNLLADLQRSRGLAYLFIAHDLAVVRHISDRVAVLYRGRVVEVGDADAVADDPRHPYTQALVSAAPVVSPRAREARDAARRRARVREHERGAPAATRGCPFADRCPQRFALCDEVAPAPRAAGASVVACHLHPEPTTMEGPDTHDRPVD